MNRFLLAIVALLGKKVINNTLSLLSLIVYSVLAPIVSCSISCYVGSSGSYAQLSGYDVCYVSNLYIKNNLMYDILSLM